jgi:hypothetical protein
MSKKPAIIIQYKLSYTFWCCKTLQLECLGFQLQFDKQAVVLYIHDNISLHINVNVLLVGAFHSIWVDIILLIFTLVNVNDWKKCLFILENVYFSNRQCSGVGHIKVHCKISPNVMAICYRGSTLSWCTFWTGFPHKTQEKTLRALA